MLRSLLNIVMLGISFWIGYYLVLSAGDLYRWSIDHGFISRADDAQEIKLSLTENTSQESCPADQSEFYDNCIGTFKRNNGDWYIGEFKNDRMDGFGTYNYADGGMYKGGFKEDKRHGSGELKLADGSFYVGNFEDDEFNGEGLLRLTNGDSYSGLFVGGQFEGSGRYESADGTVMQGIFKDGEFVPDEVVSSSPVDQNQDTTGSETNCAGAQIKERFGLQYRYEAIKAAVFSEYSDKGVRQAYWVCPADAVRPNSRYCEEIDRIVKRSEMGGYYLENDWYVKSLFSSTEVKFNRIEQISTDLNCDSANKCVYFCEASGVVHLDVDAAVKRLMETRKFKIIGKNGEDLDSGYTFRSILDSMKRTYVVSGSNFEPLESESHTWTFNSSYCVVKTPQGLSFVSRGFDSVCQ